jgi:hypothetical protein
VPWGRLLALIAPHYPKAGPKGGRPPMPLETMLRVYFLKNCYALSDPMVEETLYDSESMRRFAGIELGDDRIPDETAILNFRHLLEPCTADLRRLASRRRSRRHVTRTARISQRWCRPAGRVVALERPHTFPRPSECTACQMARDRASGVAPRGVA